MEKIETKRHIVPDISSAGATAAIMKINNMLSMHKLHPENENYSIAEIRKLIEEAEKDGKEVQGARNSLKRIEGLKKVKEIQDLIDWEYKNPGTLKLLSTEIVRGNIKEAENMGVSEKDRKILSSQILALEGFIAAKVIASKLKQLERYPNVLSYTIPQIQDGINEAKKIEVGEAAVKNHGERLQELQCRLDAIRSRMIAQVNADSKKAKKTKEASTKKAEPQLPSQPQLKRSRKKKAIVK